MKTGQGSSSEMYGVSKDPLLSATIAAFLSVGVAQAQEAPAPEAPTPAPAAAPEATPAPATEGADGAAAPGQASDENSATAAEKELETDLNRFWGKRREVSVVQRRLVEKDGRFEATPFFSTIPNDDFIVYFPMGLRLGYHFSEQFAVELAGAYAVQKESGLTSFLQDEEGLALKEAQIQEKIGSYYTADVLWAPFYGKISVLGAKLTHFETYIGLGGGLVVTETTTPENPNPQDKYKPAGNAVLGFRWFITDWLNVRTDYRHFFFEKFGGGVSIPAEFSLGAGFMFP